MVSTLIVRPEVHVELRKMLVKEKLQILVANDSNYAANDLAVAA